MRKYGSHIEKQRKRLSNQGCQRSGGLISNYHLTYLSALMQSRAKVLGNVLGKMIKLVQQGFHQIPTTLTTKKERGNPKNKSEKKKVHQWETSHAQTTTKIVIVYLKQVLRV